MESGRKFPLKIKVHPPIKPRSHSWASMRKITIKRKLSLAKPHSPNLPPEPCARRDLEATQKVSISCIYRSLTLPDKGNTAFCRKRRDLGGITLSEGPPAQSHKHLLMSLRDGIQRLIPMGSFRRKPDCGAQNHMDGHRSTKGRETTQEVSEGERRARRPLDGQKGRPPLHWLL